MWCFSSLCDSSFLPCPCLFDVVIESVRHQFIFYSTTTNTTTVSWWSDGRKRKAKLILSPYCRFSLRLCTQFLPFAAAANKLTQSYWILSKLPARLVHSNNKFHYIFFIICLSDVYQSGFSVKCHHQSCRPMKHHHRTAAFDQDWSAVFFFVLHFILISCDKYCCVVLDTFCAVLYYYPREPGARDNFEFILMLKYTTNLWFDRRVMRKVSKHRC